LRQVGRLRGSSPDRDRRKQRPRSGLRNVCTKEPQRILRPRRHRRQLPDRADAVQLGEAAAGQAAGGAARGGFTAVHATISCDSSTIRADARARGRDCCSCLSTARSRAVPQRSSRPTSSPLKRSDPAGAGPRFVVSAPEARPRGLDAPQAPDIPAYAPEGAALGCHAGGACGPPSVGTSEGYTSLPWIA
jgi:hypothetical protein